MSRFYATIQGERGEASRTGHHNIRGHVRGWSVGVEVRGCADLKNEDRFDVFVTGGSTYSTERLFVGTARSVNGILRFEATPE